MSTVYLVWGKDFWSNEELFEGVFANKEIAEKFVDIQCQGEYRIEEWEARAEL
jgi:hypothetical protein